MRRSNLDLGLVQESTPAISLDLEPLADNWNILQITFSDWSKLGSSQDTPIIALYYKNACHTYSLDAHIHIMFVINMFSKLVIYEFIF